LSAEARHRYVLYGADEALEQQNRAMKVTGRLVGIMQNPNALARYFPTAPELQSISSDTIEMIGTSEQTNHEKHHINNFSAYRTQESAIILKSQQKLSVSVTRSHVMLLNSLALPPNQCLQ